MKIKRQRNRFRKSRKSLTLLFSGSTFVIFLAIVLVVGSTIVIFVKTGLMELMTDQLFGWAFILLVVYGLLVGAGITYLLSRVMMKPMNKVVNAMNELASGNFKARLHLGRMLESNPTIKEMIDSFNAMANELDHTEILRSDFINSFSHEFKTPIVSISGFAKLLKTGNITESQRAEYTDIIFEESMRLSDMATGVLSLSRIENQTILTNVTRYNLSEQIRSCILLLEEKWSKKELEIDPDFAEYEITANEEQLKQVWINILENAVKFANKGGRIGVSVTPNGRMLDIRIENTGSFIEKEDRERIFVKFYQCDRSHTQTGNGIGLAIAKQIVMLHGGSIVCTSDEDVTAFTVSLPTDLRS